MTAPAVQEVRCVRQAMSVWSGCRCPDCRVRNLRLRKLNKAGLYRRVPSEVGVAALDRMIRAGYSNLAVASATGVNEHTASQWLAIRRQGLPLRLGPAACLALVRAGKPTEGSIDSVVARRKLQALACIGHSCRRVADVINVKPTTLSSIRGGATGKVHSALALQIDDAYRQLWTKPGTSWKARRLAEARRWAGPLSWDNIEDLDEQPSNGPTCEIEVADPIAVWRVISGNRPAKLSKADRTEVVHQLTAKGVSPNMIRERYGIVVSRLQEAL